MIDLHGPGVVAAERDHSAKSVTAQCAAIASALPRTNGYDRASAPVLRIAVADRSPHEIGATYDDCCAALRNKVPPVHEKLAFFNAPQGTVARRTTTFREHLGARAFEATCEKNNAIEVICHRYPSSADHDLKLVVNLSAPDGLLAYGSSVIESLARDHPVIFQVHPYYDLPSGAASSGAGDVHKVDFRPREEREVVTPSVARVMQGTFLMINALERAVGDLRVQAEATAAKEARDGLTDRITALELQLAEVRPHARAHARTLEAALASLPESEHA